MSKIFATAVLFVLLAVLAPARASAQRGATPVPYATMDRAERRSQVGGAGSLIFLTDTAPDGDTELGLRLDIFGQWVHSSGFGFLAQMPVFSFVFVDEADPGIGDIDLGMLYTHRIRRGRILVRGAVGIPTASDDAENRISTSAGALARVTDFVLMVPATSLRLGTSWMLQRRRALVRIDGGLDVPFDEQDPILRLNVGAGTRIGHRAVLLGELANTIGFDELRGDNSISSLALTIGARSGIVTGSFVLPLDDGISGDVFILTISGRATF